MKNTTREEYEIVWNDGRVVCWNTSCIQEARVMVKMLQACNPLVAYTCTKITKTTTTTETREEITL